jgi:hypothetical protein
VVADVHEPLVEVKSANVAVGEERVREWGV